MRTRIIALLLALSASLFAQQAVQYVATTGTVSLAAGYAATLQQPATSSQQTSVTFPSPQNTQGAMPRVSAVVWCSVACVATISRNCTTPATATAGTLTSILANQYRAFVTFWTASNASGCTSLVEYNIGAGEKFPIDFSGFSLPTGGTSQNLHISIAAVAGNGSITFFPVEQH